MKILVTVDKKGSAIDRLAEMNKKDNPHHQFRIVPVHPKRPDQKQLDAFISGYAWCDIWDCQYWKTGEKIFELYPDMPKNKPSILTHHNPYNLLEGDWSKYTKVVTMNKTQKKVLKDSTLIQHAVDMEAYSFNDDYQEDGFVMMIAARIESKKGIEPVARACKEIGYKFVLVGLISDRDYFNKIMEHGTEFYENIPEDQLISLYDKAAIHVCNSVDNFESGTLPILNSMAKGVPVLTRLVGLVPDIYNEENMLIFTGVPDDVEGLKRNLRLLMEDKKWRRDMRSNAWHSVRNYDSERRAYRYSKLYYDIFYKNPLVSLIMPVFGNADKLQDKITLLDKQTYPAIEYVIVSDGDSDFDSLEIKSDRTIKYIRSGTKESYGLGLARDTGVLHAEGEIIVFLDQRFMPDKNMVYEFVKNLKPKTWLYGNKGLKKNFVENVSCMYRQEFIDMGMSNQLMIGYGGMSQELRERSRRQGIRQIFIEKAVATADGASHKRNSKKEEIKEMKLRLWKLGL